MHGQTALKFTAMSVREKEYIIRKGYKCLIIIIIIIVWKTLYRVWNRYVIKYDRSKHITALQ